MPRGQAAGESLIVRIGLEFLVLANVAAQDILLFVLVAGQAAAKVAPLAGGSVVSLFLLMFFYARWMFPFLRTRHILALVLVRELAIVVLAGVAVAVTAGLRALTG